MPKTILKTSEITLEKSLISDKVNYEQMEVRHDASTGKFSFFIGPNDGQHLYEVKTVFGIDGIGNETAMLSVLGKKKTTVSRSHNNEFTIRLVDKQSGQTPHNDQALSSENDSSGLLDKDSLISTMQSLPLTDGWDMVVVYGLTTLNNVLETIYSDPTGKVVKNIILGSDDTPYQSTYTVISIPKVFTGLSLSVLQTINMAVETPVMSFEADVDSSSNSAILNMPISSVTSQSYDFTLELINPQPSGITGLTNNNVWYKSTDGKTFTEVSVSEVSTANQSDWSLYYLKAQDPSLSTVYNNMIYNLASVNPPNTQPSVDPGFALQAIVPISGVTGSGEVQPGDDVISFDGTGGTGTSIVLDFQTSNNQTTYTFTQNGQPYDPTILINSPNLLEDIKNYFITHVSAIDYSLTSITNTNTGGVVPLTPKNFRLQTQQVNGQGYLALFIQTNESGLGEGGSNLVFQDVNNSPFVPLCNEANTTVMFSRDFMSKFYLPTGLSNCGYTDATNIGNENVPISVSAVYTFQETLNIKVSLNLSFWQSLSSGYTSADADPVNFNGVPMSITFTDSNNLTLAVNAVETTNLNLHYFTPGGPCMPPISGTDTYPVTITTQINNNAATVPLQWVTDSQGDLSFAFSVGQNDYTPNISVSGFSESCDSISINDINSQIQSQVGAILPQQNVTLETLKTVAETNLLFNGQQRFTLDTSLNVSSPRDIVMFGNIS
ncbi:hypothetical protein F3J23_10750 [Chryseobacterium sp. Tr-659]|uniref:hypothetical protein n=1 Tax=Chryseobacterium sp. Tr-659 TaxID=2608340 RepID=UPI0014243E39|nr:hypothetical protein [Chryseobacterium sp. Tr-659]NIF05920.1 hypothetical protein [Chryseobacterium sp. Tr-659]